MTANLSTVLYHKLDMRLEEKPVSKPGKDADTRGHRVRVSRLPEAYTMTANLSTVLYSKLDMRLEEKPVPEPGNDEVQITVKRVGICGTDLNFWQHGRTGSEQVVRQPLTLGHECSGIVTKVENGVTHLKEMVFIGVPHNNGAMARCIVHKADRVYRIPDELSFEEGALLEPLSVGIYACRRVRLEPGHSLLICGAGPVGLWTMLAAKEAGVENVIVTDINEKRLAMSKEMGAKHTFRILPEDDVTTVAVKVISKLGSTPDRTIECSGAQFSVDLGIAATRAGGVFVIVGHGPERISFPVMTLLTKELEILGSFRYANTCMASGHINGCIRKTESEAPCVTYFPPEGHIESSHDGVIRRGGQGYGGLFHMRLIS